MAGGRLRTGDNQHTSDHHVNNRHTGEHQVLGRRADPDHTSGDVLESDTADDSSSADYSLSRVPRRARLGWHTVTIQTFGQAGNIGLLMLGVALGSAFGFAGAQLMLATGLAIQAVTLIAMGLMGAREGIATTVLTRWTGLGRQGSALLGVVLATSAIGWFIVLNATVASGFSSVAGGPRWIWALVVGGAFTLIVMFGFGLMARTASVTAPAFLALTVYLVIAEVSKKGFGAVLSTPGFSPGMTTAFAITSVVAIWLMGIIVQPDMTRYARSGGDVVKIALCGTLLGQYLICTAGILLALATRTDDIVGIVTAGSAVLGMVFLITATANIQAMNLYVGTLSLANALDTWFSWRPRAAMISLVVGLVSAGVTALGVLNDLSTFLNLLGVLLPPVVGIMLAEYYVVRRWNSLLDATRATGRLPDHAPGWVVSSIVVWIISSTVGFTVTAGITVINSLASAFVLSVVSGGVMRALSRLTGASGLSPAEQVFAIDIEVPEGVLPAGAFRLDPNGGVMAVERPRETHRNATELLVRLTNGTIDGRANVVGAFRIRAETNGAWPNADGAPLVAVRLDWTGDQSGPRALPPVAPEETTVAAREAISTSAPWRHGEQGVRVPPPVVGRFEPGGNGHAGPVGPGTGGRLEPVGPGGGPVPPVGPGTGGRFEPVRPGPFPPMGTGNRIEPVGDSGPRPIPPHVAGRFPANGRGHGVGNPVGPRPVNERDTSVYRPVRHVDPWRDQPSPPFEPVRGPVPAPPARVAAARYADPASDPRNPYVGPPPERPVAPRDPAPGHDEPPAARTSPNLPPVGNEGDLFGWFGGDRRP